MTVQKRLLVWLLVIAPLVWLGAFMATYWLARAEVDEFFDTRQLSMAAQVLALTPQASRAGQDFKSPIANVKTGAAEPEDLLIVMWNADGTLLSPGTRGLDIPFLWETTGFINAAINGKAWRLLYLRGGQPETLVAVGLAQEERTEVLWELLGAHLGPLLVALLVLIVAIVIAVNRAFVPLRDITASLKRRSADDLDPIHLTGVPSDIAPLIESLNALFLRIRSAMEHERRLTADASHELRTPIAALKAHWDAWTLAGENTVVRDRSVVQMGLSLDRLSRLVGQLLSLSAIESQDAPRTLSQVSWPQVVENAISDVLPMMDASGGEIDVEWPEIGDPLPMDGDNALLSAMLRNLLDNSLRYGGTDVRVRLRFAHDRIIVEDSGPGISAALRARIGSRFFRPPGQSPAGSGIGLSIVLRVARLHELSISFKDSEDPAYPGLMTVIEKTTSSALTP